MQVVRATDSGQCFRVKKAVLDPFKTVMVAVVGKAEPVVPEMVQGSKKIIPSGGDFFPPAVNEKAAAKIKLRCLLQSQTEKRVQCQN